MLDRIVVELLKNKVDVMAYIKKLAMQADVRGTERQRYVVRLINIARQHNLL